MTPDELRAVRLDRLVERLIKAATGSEDDPELIAIAMGAALGCIARAADADGGKLLAVLHATALGVMNGSLLD